MLVDFLYGWGGANVAVFKVLNGMHGGWFDAVMIAGTRLADKHIVLLLIAAAITFVMLRGRDAAAAGRLGITLAIAYMATSAAVLAMKHLAALPRPAEALGRELVTVVHEPDDPFSFPSGHAARAAMIAAALWPHLTWQWRVVAALFVTWVAVSRVALGAHFPADVLAGVAVGALIGWLSPIGTERLGSFKKPRRPTLD